MQELAIILSFVGWCITFGLFCGIYVRTGRVADHLVVISRQIAALSAAQPPADKPAEPQSR